MNVVWSVVMKSQKYSFNQCLKYKSIIHTVAISVITTFLSSNLNALNIDEYINQVIKNNQDVQSNNILMQSGFTRSEEGFLVTAPHMLGQISYISDSQPQISTALKGRKTETQNYNIGIAKKFDTGTRVKLEYDNTHYSLTSTSPSLIKDETLWFAKPIASLEQPLFRDWLGSETKSLIKLKNSQMLAQGHSKKFATQKIIADAKTTYWDLATIQSDIKIKQESIKRANKLLDWANKRTSLGLSNSSDAMQAQAALLQRELELKSLQNMHTAKARLFNALRNIQSDEVKESLDSFTKINLSKLSPEQSQMPDNIREDLKAHYQAYQVAKQQANIATESIKPNINLNLQYYPSGRDTTYKHTAAEAWRAKHNTFSVGVAFDVPLSLTLNRNLTSAYKAEKHAAQLALSYKQFEVSNEWQQLTQQFNLLLSQLDLSDRLQKSQQKKLENEQDLLKKGRSTTFQVIQFEQDYLTAQSMYFNNKNKLLRIQAAMDLFKA